MNTSLHLPAELQQFHKPTVLIVADHERANIWLASGETINLIQQLHEPRERKTDREGGLRSTSGQSVTAEDHSEDERLRHYIASISAVITSSIRGKNAALFSLVMPTDVSRPVLARFDADVRAAHDKTLNVDLVNEEILEVLKRMNGA